MPALPNTYIDKVPAYSIRDECLHIEIADFAELVMPLRTARLAMVRVTKVIAEHDAKVAEVVPFKGRRRGHAADA